MFPKDVDFDVEVENIREEDDFLFNMRFFSYDFENQELILEDGNPVILEGPEAVQMWVKKNLLTKLHAYKIYFKEDDGSREYGSSLVDLLRGKKYPRVFVLAEAERDVREMCAQNPYIQNIQNFEVSHDGVRGRVKFDVILRNYEVVEIDEEVDKL